MNAKAVAMCSLFAALAIVLYRVRIPVPSFQLYFWEIPIVIALLLFGPKFGFSVAVVSVFSQAIVFPSSMGIVFPIWNLIAMSTSLAAIALVQWLIRNWNKGSESKSRWPKPIVLLVLAALISREALMPFINYFMYKFMMPLVGLPQTDLAITTAITLSLIYDAILILYTVPSSYYIAKRVNMSLKMGNTIV
jgi:riboflavin transporter FmnP